VQAFRAAGLPTQIPRLQGPAHYRDLMAIDKKAEGGSIRYVLLKRMGEAYVSAVDNALVDAALDASFERSGEGASA
jgi:3-dehydroquinate synthase